MNGDDQRLGDLMELIAEQEGLSAARACKRLGLSRSELQRMLVILSVHSSMDALGLVRVEEQDGRQRLWLTDKARAGL